MITLNRKPGLYLKKTRRKGRGLYCLYDIIAEEELEVTPSIILNQSASRHTDKTILRDYVFSTGRINQKLQQEAKVKDIDTSCCVVMGIASYCNHSDRPNAEVVWQQRGHTLYYILRATANIPKNTEICTSYGEEWFDDKPGRAKA